jgi:hypothetical protein
VSTSDGTTGSFPTNLQKMFPEGQRDSPQAACALRRADLCDDHRSVPASGQRLEVAGTGVRSTVVRISMVIFDWPLRVAFGGRNEYIWKWHHFQPRGD